MSDTHAKAAAEHLQRARHNRVPLTNAEQIAAAQVEALLAIAEQLAQPTAAR